MERDIGKSYAGYKAGYRRDIAGYKEFTARMGSVPAAHVYLVANFRKELKMSQKHNISYTSAPAALMFAGTASPGWLRSQGPD